MKTERHKNDELENFKKLVVANKIPIEVIREYLKDAENEIEVLEEGFYFPRRAYCDDNIREEREGK